MIVLNKILDFLQIFNFIYLGVIFEKVESFIGIILLIIQIVLIIVNFVLKFKNSKTIDDKIKVVEDFQEDLEDLKGQKNDKI